MIGDERGFTLVEVLVAATMLIVGIMTALTAMDAARKLTLVSERRTSVVQRAEAELERLKSLPFSQVALTGTSASWSSTSSDYTYVNAPAGTCPGSPAGAAPTYQPDHSVGAVATEPLVLDGCTYTVAGVLTPVAGGTVVPATPWSDGRLTGYVYDFVTWTADPTCAQTPTPGSNCATSNDYKRITVVVTLTGAVEPAHPVIVSGYVANPNQNSTQNVTQNPNTRCLNSSGQTVSCSNTLSGTPLQYFLCDSSYSGGACGQPPCSGNVLHKTLVGVLGLLAPVPDLLESALPSGVCMNGSVPTPPCYAVDLGGGCQGLPIVPNGSSSCGSPPSDNTKSHTWVTPSVPVGTTENLNGTGSLTAYLMSGSGVAANVTVCLGVYVVPGGVLGNLLGGSLLQSPIGVAVSANVTAQAGVPTPVSFNFNLGSAAQVVGSVLGTRVEVVLWLAASASTNVSLAYDQAQFASQLTLIAT